MKKFKLFLILLLTFSIKGFNQNIHWGYPANDNLDTCDIIVLEPFIWSYNGQLDSSAILYFEEMKFFLSSNRAKFKFEILIHKDSKGNPESNLSLTKLQSKRIMTLLSQDVEFINSVDFVIKPMGSETPIFNKKAVKSLGKYSKLGNYLNNRVEIHLLPI